MDIRLVRLLMALALRRVSKVLVGCGCVQYVQYIMKNIVIYPNFPTKFTQEGSSSFLQGLPLFNGVRLAGAFCGVLDIGTGPGYSSGGCKWT